MREFLTALLVLVTTFYAWVTFRFDANERMEYTTAQSDMSTGMGHAAGPIQPVKISHESKENDVNMATKCLLLILCFTPLPASAIEDMEVAKCATDTNAITRLECFDKLATAHSLAPKTLDTTTPNKSRWITYSKIDPLTDKYEYYAAVPASSGKGTHGEPVSLVLACIGTTRYMHINWQSFLGSDNVKVTYRFGKDPAKTELWNVSNDSKATFYPWSLLGILKQLEKTSTFAASLTPYKENAITAIFDISGAHEAFKDLQKNCQW